MNPSIHEDHDYQLMRPRRVIARALFGNGLLSLGHDLLLSRWIETRTPDHRGLAVVSRSNSLIEEPRKLPRRVRIETIRPDDTCKLSYRANGIVTLFWIAP
jgi:hypothetical protein